VGLKRGPLSLVRITEELLEWKSCCSGSRTPRLTAVGIRCADHATPRIRRNLALTSPTCGDRSVGIVRLRTKATAFNLGENVKDIWNNKLEQTEPLIPSRHSTKSGSRSQDMRTSLFLTTTHARKYTYVTWRIVL
jgi:hypothetical protein